MSLLPPPTMRGASSSVDLFVLATAEHAAQNNRGERSVPSVTTGSMASGPGVNPGASTGAPLAGSASTLHLPDGFIPMRRRSILGPPSLFPAQRHRQSSGGINFTVPAGGGGGGGAASSSAGPRKTSTTQDDVCRKTSDAGTQAADEVATTIADLDFYYGLVKRQILRYQCPTTGLFPELSSDKERASVRSTIYSSMAVWSLYQAYKRIDDDRGKTYELGQSTVLGMRGILCSWMRQSKRLEAFKCKQFPENALHSVFNLDTGSEILSVEEYNHLQIDVVSLYILFLVQAIASGLQIIFDMNEVAFVQNLVYYVERAYRTPDFGMWERGTKFNDGTPEVNASSIGLAKAALEAVNGVNLFGENGASWSVVYTDIDAHNRNRSIFETLLPRESASKDVDVALLPTISFPAFATHDAQLYSVTKAKIVDVLEGRHGFKRFVRDGYGAVGEFKNERFYSEGMIQQFEGVESEWPMFFAFMVIDGVFQRKPEQVDKYHELLKKRLAYNEQGDPVLPQFYYVGEGNLPKKGQQAQHRTASNDGCSSTDLHLWAQSMLIISDLLTSQLLNVYELDPIRRHLPSYSRPKWGHRYSAFEKGGGSVSSADLVVQVVTIAESIRLQSVLNTYGIMTQTPNEIEPVQIWSQWQMVKVYEQLGRNESLGLKGRPSRPIGSLGSSKIYRLCGQTVICYPLCMSASDFYLSHDMAHLTDDIRSELKFISRCWRLSGRPTVCVLVTESHMRDPQFPVLLDFLAQLRSGSVDGVKVRLGRLQNLVASSCLEHLDFLQHHQMEGLVEAMGGDDGDVGRQRFGQLQNEHIGYQTLTDIPMQKSLEEEDPRYNYEYKEKSTDEVVSAITSCKHIYGNIQLLGILLKKEGGDFMVGDLTVTHRLELLNRKAGSLRHWAAVRYSSSLLRQMVDSISPFVTQILVNGKQVTVGTIGEDYSLFAAPMTPAEIKEAIYTKVQPFNTIGAVIQQELILYCGKLIATNPELFEGILKVRIGWILDALDRYRKMKEPDPDPIESCSPSEIRRTLYRVLKESRALQLTYKGMERKALAELDTEFGHRMTVYQVREINGCLNRVPQHFYKDVWQILHRAPGGIKLGGHFLPQQPTITNMTSTDAGFSHTVETMISINYANPTRKQLVAELFCVMSAILRRNPELECCGSICVDKLVQAAVDLYLADNPQDDPAKEDGIEDIFLHEPVPTTSSYLARSVLNNILKGSILQRLQQSDKRTDYNCPVQ